MEIGIGSKLGVGDGIIVVLAVNGLTVMDDTLPLPDILAGGELAETDEVGTTVALMVKLARTLVEDKLEEGIVVGKVVGPHVGGTGTLA